MNILYYFLIVYLISIPWCYYTALYILKESNGVKSTYYTFPDVMIAKAVSGIPVINTGMAVYGSHLILKSKLSVWLVMRKVNKIARKHGYKNIKDMADNSKNK